MEHLLQILIILFLIFPFIKRIIDGFNEKDRQAAQRNEHQEADRRDVPSPWDHPEEYSWGEPTESDSRSSGSWDDALREIEELFTGETPKRKESESPESPQTAPDQTSKQSGEKQPASVSSSDSGSRESYRTASQTAGRGRSASREKSAEPDYRADAGSDPWHSRTSTAERIPDSSTARSRQSARTSSGSATRAATHGASTSDASKRQIKSGPSTAEPGSIDVSSDLMKTDNPIYKSLDETPEVVVSEDDELQVDYSKRLHDTQYLRHAFVIKEILDPPSSLRRIRR